MKKQINEARFQFLAGIITENEYNKILKESAILDRLLDKISDQGIDSLSFEEKEYLDSYSKGDIDAPAPASGNIAVYVSDPFEELYKIENLPAIPDTNSVGFTCKDTNDDSVCKNYPEMIKLLQNKNMKLILDKIQMDAYGEGGGYFHGVEFGGSFFSPTDVAYAQLAGDGMLYFVDSLDRFSEGYNTEEEWGVKNWKKI
jgi:hypothetical protein